MTLFGFETLYKFVVLVLVFVFLLFSGELLFNINNSPDKNSVKKVSNCHFWGAGGSILTLFLSEN